MRISAITYAVRRPNKKVIILKVFIILLLITFIVSMGLSFYVGWSLTHPSQKVSSFDFTKLSIPQYKDAAFTDNRNTVELKGRYFKATNSDKTIILAHGFTSNSFQFDEKTIDMIKSFIEKGYSMLIFDFRASGSSGGKTSTVGYYEQNDLLGAINFVKKEGSKHIVLLGVSMGASTSIITASRSKDVDAVIADTPFSNLQSYLIDGLPKWSPLPAILNQPTLLAARLFSGVDVSKVDPLKSLKDLSPRPLLLIHSVNDPTIPITNSRDLYASYSKLVGDKTELWETDVNKHVGSYSAHPNEYMTKVFEFLDKTIQK
jgi:uncharacterized protein